MRPPRRNCCLLMHVLLSLSVLDLPTSRFLPLHLQKSGFLRFLNNLFLLRFSLLDIRKTHAHDWPLHLEGLLAATSALLSSLHSQIPRRVVLPPSSYGCVSRQSSIEYGQASSSGQSDCSTCDSNSARAGRLGNSKANYLPILADVHTTVSGVDFVLRERTSQGSKRRVRCAFLRSRMQVAISKSPTLQPFRIIRLVRMS